MKKIIENKCKMEVEKDNFILGGVTDSNDLISIVNEKSNIKWYRSLDEYYKLNDIDLGFIEALNDCDDFVPIIDEGVLTFCYVDEEITVVEVTEEWARHVGEIEGWL